MLTCTCVDPKAASTNARLWTTWPCPHSCYLPPFFHLVVENIDRPATPRLWVDQEQYRLLSSCCWVKVCFQLLRSVFGAHCWRRQCAAWGDAQGVVARGARDVVGPQQGGDCLMPHRHSFGITHLEKCTLMTLSFLLSYLQNHRPPCHPRLCEGIFLTWVPEHTQAVQAVGVRGPAWVGIGRISMFIVHVIGTIAYERIWIILNLYKWIWGKKGWSAWKIRRSHLDFSARTPITSLSFKSSSEAPLGIWVIMITP